VAGLLGLCAGLAVLFLGIGLGRRTSTLDEFVANFDEEGESSQTSGLERFAEKWVRNMALAGWRFSFTEMLWMELLGGGFFGILLLIIAHLGVFSFILGWLSVGMLTFALMKASQIRREKKIESQLIRAVMVMSSLLSSSGATTKVALEEAGNRVGPPLGPELQRISEAVGVGANLGDAVDDATPRIGSPEWTFFAKAVRLQEEHGGNISLMLDKIAETLTARIRTRGKAKALLSEAQVSQYFLAAAVPGIVGLMAIDDPSTVHLLFTKDLFMAIIAGFLWVLGMVVVNFMIRRIEF